MSSTLVALLFALWITIAGVAVWVWQTLHRRRLTQRRLEPLNEQEAGQQLQSDATRSKLGWWLFRAGFRSKSATPTFLVLSLLGLLVGAAFIASIYWAELVDLASGLASSVPGGVGEVFLPLIWASPWLAGLLLGFLPAIVVRARRRRRVREVEQDLPITLDLLATLAEAGFGFDSALDRFLETQPSRRPLSEDLQLFQIDMLAGRPRVEALRRLMKRVDVPWFSIFVSAVIHAEQVGSSLAQTLRVQADDLRMRRRERALALAMAVPVKLLFPLIVCFLPGIMTAALGPVVFQIVQVLDSFLQGAFR
ncbi:Bacterial type II secretion system protein F domain protein [Thalassoglobus neptunius]|uniref:Bacterial type II secretion system protein F domain protein n=1 Tax=Thalassoglobus neptunius TaxID=1938619 RepID=A0A5C5X6W7_9PLAN|nr:type II secretion system F family protein [Thalassoglobus neptunius]TWT58857.1 Bacterial type II secretion system protein F domain protein [Thalassoglobus neptunius]